MLYFCFCSSFKQFQINFAVNLQINKKKFFSNLCLWKSSLTDSISQLILLIALHIFPNQLHNDLLIEMYLHMIHMLMVKSNKIDIQFFIQNIFFRLTSSQTLARTYRSITSICFGSLTGTDVGLSTSKIVKPFATKLFFFKYALTWSYGVLEFPFIN